MQNLLIGLGISAAVSIVCGILAKKLPKEKCAAWAIGLAEKLFKIIDIFLTAKTGESAAHKIEEGIVYTAAYTGAAFFNCLCDLCQKHADGIRGK